MKRKEITDETQAKACRAMCLDLTITPRKLQKRFSVEEG